MSLSIVAVVAREHGERFADGWLRRSRETGSMIDACAETDLIEWPNDPTGGDDLCVDIQCEIAQRVADQLRNTIAETFVRLANEVLARERRQ